MCAWTSIMQKLFSSLIKWNQIYIIITLLRMIQLNLSEKFSYNTNLVLFNITRTGVLCACVNKPIKKNIILFYNLYVHIYVQFIYILWSINTAILFYFLLPFTCESNVIAVSERAKWWNTYIYDLLNVLYNINNEYLILCKGNIMRQFIFHSFFYQRSFFL